MQFQDSIIIYVVLYIYEFKLVLLLIKTLQFYFYYVFCQIIFKSLELFARTASKIYVV